MIFKVFSNRQSIGFKKWFDSFLWNVNSLNLLFHIEVNWYQLNFFSGWCCGLHGLNQSLQGKSISFFKCHIFLIFLFKERVCSNVVATDSGGLPSSIVSWRISWVKLEFIVFIITGKQESSTEWSGSTDLSVVLFNVANINDDLLNWNVGSVLEFIILSIREKFTWAYYLKRLIK